MNGVDIAVEHCGAPRRDLDSLTLERRQQCDEVVLDGLGRPCRQQLILLPGEADEISRRDGKRVLSGILIAQDRPLLLLGEVLPARNLQDEAEPVHQCRIQRLGADVHVRLLVRRLRGRGRVHRRPSVPQALQFDSLHAPLVHDREELVLKLRACAVDLVDEDNLRIPDCRRSGEIPQPRPFLVRKWYPDEVVVVQKTGIVETVVHAQRPRQPFQHEALGRSVGPDQQHGLLRGERCQNDRLELRPALKPEGFGEN